jgi:predicted component of type VI protein secretion system
MIALASPRLWAAVFLALVLACSHFFAFRSGKAIVRGQWDAQRVQDAAAAQAEQDRRQASTDKEARDGQAKIAALQTELAGTRAAGDRLRAAIRTAVAAPRTTGAGEGQLGSDPLGMFGRMFTESSERNEALAGYADRLRLTGEVCERYANGLQPANGR